MTWPVIAFCRALYPGSLASRFQVLLAEAIPLRGFWSEQTWRRRIVPYTMSSILIAVRSCVVVLTQIHVA